MMSQLSPFFERLRDMRSLLTVFDSTVNFQRLIKMPACQADFLLVLGPKKDVEPCNQRHLLVKDRLLVTLIPIFINVMPPWDENSHFNAFLLSSPNRLHCTFLAIWFLEGKCGSTFTLWMHLLGLRLRCGLSFLRNSISIETFPLRPLLLLDPHGDALLVTSAFSFLAALPWAVASSTSQQSWLYYSELGALMQVCNSSSFSSQSHLSHSC